MSNAFNIGEVVLPGDFYPSIFGFTVPVRDGLEGAYLFGDGVTQIPKNYAQDKPDATVVGALSVGAGYATFNETGYLDTGITETADMTVITVARDSTGSADPAPGLIGNFIDATRGGLAISTNGATGYRATEVKDSTLRSIPILAAQENFTIQALRARNLKTSSLKNLTSGDETIGSSTAARTVYSAGTIWIGRIPNTGFKGFNDQVAALIFSRALTDAELDLVAAWLRGYCASKGIIA